MAESLTLTKLIEKWRNEAKLFNESESRVVLMAGAATSDCADELAATLTGMTCRTCKFRGPKIDWERQNCEQLGVVPILIRDRPFYCAAHTPRADRDREE